jgi:hypothetical protein
MDLTSVERVDLRRGVRTRTGPSLWELMVRSVHLLPRSRVRSLVITERRRDDRLPARPDIVRLTREPTVEEERFWEAWRRLLRACSLMVACVVQRDRALCVVRRYTPAA